MQEDCYAHISEDGRKQSVKQHLYNVADISAAIGSKLGISDIVYLQGLIHDFGKFIKEFNDYLLGRSAYTRGDIDHSYAGAKYICAVAEKTGNAEMREAADIIAEVVISHHGLHDWVCENGDDYLQKRIAKDERYEQIYKNISGFISEETISEYLRCAVEQYRVLVKKICELSGRKAQKESCFYVGMLQRLLESVLIDADRTDTADFMSGRVTEPESDSAGLWDAMHSRLEEKYRGFQANTDRISVARTDISERCATFAANDVGICRLVVPTGGGKTLSSLRFAVEYCRIHGMNRIIYVAPYMSILEQNSDAIREIAGDDAFLEHYSDAAGRSDGREELASYELLTERWNCPVIATTMVQFLNTLFSGSNSSIRRMHRLCRAVIIIDEVQSIPVKCVHLFNLAMNFLSKIGNSTIVLCSATQPMLEAVEYPLSVDENSSMTGNYDSDFAEFKRVELINRVTPTGFSYDEAAEFCYERYSENGSLLVVMNTKKSALEIYNRMVNINLAAGNENVAQVVYLSTSMCPQHRRDVLAAVKEKLNNRNKLICISTQLIEAGVDISFNCVVRSLAGLDSAAQAAGRCNRNGEYPCSPVYLIRIADEQLGRLSEIKSAQDVSTQILSVGAFADLLLPDALAVYFCKYYEERRTELSYKASDLGVQTSLLAMLSDNSLRRNIKNKVAPQYAQAFASAAKQFRVIDENTEPVLVPYNAQATELIADLNGKQLPYIAAKLLRKSQKYLVSVYPQTKKLLEKAGALYAVADGLLLVLKPGFYNEKIGIELNGKDENYYLC